jgi:hypothetical protein
MLISQKWVQRLREVHPPNLPEVRFEAVSMVRVWEPRFGDVAQGVAMEVTLPTASGHHGGGVAVGKIDGLWWGQ